jgi:hypothetical protein
LKVSRVLAVVAAAVLASGFAIVGATPASAAFDRDATCATVSERNTTNTLSAGFAIEAEAGQTLTVTVSNPTGDPTDAELQVEGGTVASGSSFPVVMTYTFAETRRYAPVVARLHPRTDQLANFSFSCSDPVPTPAIPAWVQAYGRFGPDVACQTGWNPSWQKWAEPVTGGWVCTRSIPSLG